ncbi:DUF202 domain-containing protein [Streptomyces alkaliphilus]|uniref:DUF202 domain-containing protein n=1 Tax=Streptomyces alkaliphilus TaxID=1472722 RepID=A0A7W3Y0C6_9ACTN|nr:DUF202 domain-containing protein [Streptomyces alkaliphilus]MBB0243162.1 DUF202 domain-containing protein [Streptomyces alkaliphilus]
MRAGHADATAPDPLPVRDPAVQPERTDMAWWRTVLAFAVLTLLVWRGAVMAGDPVGFAVAGIATVGWASFGWLARRRTAELRRGRPRPPAVRYAVVAMVPVTVLVPAVAAGAAFTTR